MCLYISVAGYLLPDSMLAGLRIKLLYRRKTLGSTCCRAYHTQCAGLRNRLVQRSPKDRVTRCSVREIHTKTGAPRQCIRRSKFQFMFMLNQWLNCNNVQLQLFPLIRTLKMIDVLDDTGPIMLDH